MPKTGFYKYNTGGTFCSTVCSTYCSTSTILSILFHFADFLHWCFSRTLPLQNFNVIVNTTGWECF